MLDRSPCNCCVVLNSSCDCVETQLRCKRNVNCMFNNLSKFERIWRFKFDAYVKRLLVRACIIVIFFVEMVRPELFCKSYD